MHNQPNKVLKGLTYLINIIGIISAIPVMLYIAKPDFFSIWFFTLGFMVLLAFPYFLFLLMNHCANKKALQSTIIFFASLIALIYAGCLFYYGFVMNAQGQNGLFLLYVPIAQIGLAVLVAILTCKMGKNCCPKH
ncbi:MAG: hypothetical protein KIT27_12235 [Legionellales bacterium]|nr:hypothetical protein [Legionellales bacterium]